MTVTFDPCDSSETITINIIADNSKEDTEILEIRMEASDESDLIVEPTIAVIHIEDASAKSKLIRRSVLSNPKSLSDIRKP